MSPECARNWTDHFLGPKGGEISLWVTPQSCVVRSSEDVPPLVPNKASKDLANRMQISTEVVVPVTDFDDFEIGQETRLTFNLKEFKVSLGVFLAASLFSLSEPGGLLTLLTIRFAPLRFTVLDHPN